MGESPQPRTCLSANGRDLAITNHAESATFFNKKKLLILPSIVCGEVDCEICLFSGHECNACIAHTNDEIMSSNLLALPEEHPNKEFGHEERPAQASVDDSRNFRLNRCYTSIYAKRNAQNEGQLKQRNRSKKRKSQIQPKSSR